jgi:hypothetical protein
MPQTVMLHSPDDLTHLRFHQMRKRGVVRVSRREDDLYEEGNWLYFTSLPAGTAKDVVLKLQATGWRRTS